MNHKLPSLLLVSLLLGASGSPVVNPVTGQAERSVMSEADEAAEGQKAHTQVLQEYGALNNPRLQACENLPRRCRKLV